MLKFLRTLKKTHALLATLVFLGLSGCKDDSPAEKTAEDIEEAAEDTGDAVDDAADDVEDELD